MSKRSEQCSDPFTKGLASVRPSDCVRLHQPDPTSAWPSAWKRKGGMVVPLISHHLCRSGAVANRDVDAELHPAGLYPRPHRPPRVRRRSNLHATRAAPRIIDSRRGARRQGVEAEASTRHAVDLCCAHAVPCLSGGTKRCAGRNLWNTARNRHRKRVERTSLPGKHALARAPSGPARSHQPELCHDQRQPGDGARARCSTRCDRHEHGANFHRKRCDLHLFYHRVTYRADARRARQIQ